MNSVMATLTEVITSALFFFFYYYTFSCRRDVVTFLKNSRLSRKYSMKKKMFNTKLKIKPPRYNALTK